MARDPDAQRVVVERIDGRLVAVEYVKLTGGPLTNREWDAGQWADVTSMQRDRVKSYERVFVAVQGGA